MRTAAEIAKWAVGGDFPSGESEALGIIRVTEWINDLIEAERQALAAREKDQKMKNQIQTAITQRDRAVQVALNFVGHHILSSDGSYDLLIECVLDAIRDGAASQVAITAQAERQECLKILQKAYQEWFDGDHSPGEAFESAKERIQARNNSPT